MTTHTSALDHILAEAFSHGAEPYADEIDVKVSGRRIDGTVAEYRIYVWRDGTAYTAAAPVAGEAVRRAMQVLKEARDGH